MQPVQKKEDSIIVNIADRARTMYERKQYSTALQILESVEMKPSQVHLQIMKAHASIMSVLYETDSGEPSVDTDWDKLRSRIKNARKVLEKNREHILTYHQIESRYDDLARVSNSITSAVSDGRRVVDILAGLIGQKTDCKTALLLLVLKFEAGRATAGSTSACQAVLPLPEQIFRVWAFWRLGLNYYCSPADKDQIWQDARREWSTHSLRGELATPETNKQFPSFISFAYFSLAQLNRMNPNDAETPPECDFRSLDKVQSILDEIRNTSAHALSSTTPKLRSKYFDLIDRWLGSLFSVCPEGVSREELLAIIEPLPIVDENGSIVWL